MSEDAARAAWQQRQKIRAQAMPGKERARYRAATKELKAAVARCEDVLREQGGTTFCARIGRAVVVLSIDHDGDRLQRLIEAAEFAFVEEPE